MNDSGFALVNGKHSIANEYFMGRKLLTCCGDVALLWYDGRDCGEEFSAEHSFAIDPCLECLCHAVGLLLDLGL